MKNITAKVALLLGLAITFGTAWKVSESKHTAGRRAVKNLAKEGDIEGTMAVGRRLLAELRANNFDWKAVDSSLLSVPDQYSYQFALQGQGTWTWLECRRPEYQDEVAFMCNLYTWQDFEVVPGIEGRLHVSGDYIVGWKDGRLEKVPVGDVRLYPAAGGSLIYVFPGMSEYDSALPGIADPDSAAKIAAFKAKVKSRS